MPVPDFDKSVFLNCPFDDDFEPILQAMLFCIVYMGFKPRLSSESNDSGTNRLEKISGLIEACRFSIHDLSRCEASKKGEIARLNMPFELGMDYSLRRSGGECYETKIFLVLDEERYRYQKALSDFSGFDIEPHEGEFEKAVRVVRNWLVSEAVTDGDGVTRILNAYADFQEWYYERQLAKGSSNEDILDHPTKELLVAMKEWVALGKPV